MWALTAHLATNNLTTCEMSNKLTPEKLLISSKVNHVVLEIYSNVILLCFECQMVK
jgi:hypothetical protein